MIKAMNAFEMQFGRSADFVARAPGRVEFIGNHTDYNGGEVLGAAIDRYLHVAVAGRNDSKVQFASDGDSRILTFETVEHAVSDGQGWVKYPLGVLALLGEAGIRPHSGFDYFVSSEIPTGAGLSSSAALELASSIAFEQLSGTSLSPLERVRLCRRAENEVVGVPCGILDQGVSGFGEKDRLVHIDCAVENIRTVEGPRDTRLWIFESGKKHSLVDSLYAKRHSECREALDLLRKEYPGIDNLVDVSPSDLEKMRANLADNLYRRAKHVVEEHHRVEKCIKILETGDLEAVGKLLLDSHQSSSKYFENSIPELDTLVDLLSHEPKVYGARLTGGGFGGAVMALCRTDFAEEEAKRIAGQFADIYGTPPKFRGMEISDGAGIVSL